MKRRILSTSRQGAADEETSVAVRPLRRETPPEYITQWTGNLLYWVSQRGARHFAQATASLGLLPTHVAVLQVLTTEGSMRQARLTDRTGIDKASIVALLNELEQQELTLRRPSPTDKRAFDVSLTAKGAERVRQIERISRDAEAGFFAALSAPEHEQLRELLLRLA